MLQHKMDNGATVSDWLGTAAVAAQGAARILFDARTGQEENPRTAVALAEGKLLDALDEARAVASALDRIAALNDR